MGSTSVVVRKDESFEKALRRFRRGVERAGILKETRRHMRHDKPSVRRKKKAHAARRRWQKRLRRVKRGP